MRRITAMLAAAPLLASVAPIAAAAQAPDANEPRDGDGDDVAGGEDDEETLEVPPPPGSDEAAAPDGETPDEAARSGDPDAEAVPPPSGAGATPPRGFPPERPAAGGGVPEPLPYTLSGRAPARRLSAERPPDAPRPPPTHRPNWAPIIAGAASLAVGWLGTWLGTSIWYGETTSCTSTGGWGWGYTCTHSGPDDTALGWSFAPLVGPWLMLTSESLQGGDLAYPILAGLTQLGGLVSLITGLATPQEIERPERRGELEARVDLVASPERVGVSLWLTH